MRKFVKVTLLTTLLSESGEQKIQAHSNPNISKKDQYGYTIEDWEDMKVDIPEDSIHLTEGVEDDKIEDTDRYSNTKKKKKRIWKNWRIMILICRN